MLQLFLHSLHERENRTHVSAKMPCFEGDIRQIAPTFLQMCTIAVTNDIIVVGVKDIQGCARLPIREDSILTERRRVIVIDIVRQRKMHQRRTQKSLVHAPFGKTAKGVILIPHFTIAGNDEVPSTSTIPESKHFRDEYVLIMPDYLGYGVTRDRVHPYLRGDLVARHCADMLMQANDSALFNLCADARTNLPQAPLYIVGFSEGAATALWTLRLLEQEYPQVKVAACYAGSGRN